jgi:hypothetical protein
MQEPLDTFPTGGQRMLVIVLVATAIFWTAALVLVL